MGRASWPIHVDVPSALYFNSHNNELMSKWFLWHRSKHVKVRIGFETKAEAQRHKVSVTNRDRKTPWIAVYRRMVVPATEEMINNQEYRHYFWL